MSAMFAFDARETVLVIGVGRSGLASIDVLRARGATVYATDDAASQRVNEAVAVAERSGARFVAPDRLGSVLPALTSAVLSPGVPPTSAIPRALDAAGVPVIGEIELAYRLCRAPIVAVTGTKGKSTTVALIGHLLRAAGRTVHVGGNIGDPLIKEVIDAGTGDWVVAEVSSFQLETIRSFRPRVAALLNITPDHLDRYFSMDEYAQAKYRIAANQSLTDWFVGNLDDPRVSGLHWRNGDARAQARQLWFTLGERHDRAAMFLRNDALQYVPSSGDPRPIAVASRDDVRLPGEHNVRNAMAALLAVLATGTSPKTLSDGLRTFQPMPHRLETVAEIDGVLFVDDSKSTNPDSTIAAMYSYRRPIVLIAGGRAKGTSFDDLASAMGTRVKALIAIGESAAALTSAAREVPSVVAGSMEEAVELARQRSAPGDVVLLSPACASFDMFASAEQRGERFARAVTALREPAGA
jgi:UDP-N-acetylmuramoylalanine--D-glutamate ligase